MYRSLGTNAQKGFSLITALILLAILTMIGITMMRSGMLSEKQASNVQEKSVSFHGAQTSNNAVIESYRYDETILSASLDAVDGIDTCVNSSGALSKGCENALPVDSAQGVVKAMTNTEYKQCLGALKCTGNSSGMFNDNSVGCNVFQHDGSGWVDANGDSEKNSNESVTSIEQWSLLVSACSTNS